MAGGSGVLGLQRVHEILKMRKIAKCCIKKDKERNGIKSCIYTKKEKKKKDDAIMSKNGSILK